MKFSLSPLVSDIFISVYLCLTLLFRILYDNLGNITPGNSIFIGLAFISFLYALIKLKFLNPNYFGLLKSKKD
ncbi:hypothetical protein DNU06_07160 [Putridiphycobacter roseus]|uniref:Uncharacterized protein n=1 Tax=Putridiphycobacter roseus TaxID=2219161 RepID=A0A2W1N206_9FLAO|nr:hypothetical protein [Putridiphycobacter roseus]PZE17600.1 hypothetical protein DNU06_07160 [Putridiphycobacter roseus]